MDKSTLLNEIVNHANFVPMITAALIGEETINDHLYRLNTLKHFNIPDMCDVLLTKISEVFNRDLPRVKTIFKNVFANADMSDLHELLADVINTNQCDLDCYLSDYFSDRDSPFNDLIESAFMDVLNKYGCDLVEMFEYHLNDQFELYCENRELDDRKLYTSQIEHWNNEVKSWCIGEFEEWIDCFNNVDNIPFTVLCLNAYFDCEHYYDDFIERVDDHIYNHFTLLNDY